jgi:hypothetical protein
MEAAELTGVAPPSVATETTTATAVARVTATTRRQRGDATTSSSGGEPPSPSRHPRSPPLRGLEEVEGVQRVCRGGSIR